MVLYVQSLPNLVLSSIALDKWETTEFQRLSIIPNADQDVPSENRKQVAFVVKNTRGGSPDIRIQLAIRPAAPDKQTDIELYALWIRRNGVPSAPIQKDLASEAVLHQHATLWFDAFSPGESLEVVVGYTRFRAGANEWLVIVLSPPTRTQFLPLQ